MAVFHTSYKATVTWFIVFVSAQHQDVLLIKKKFANNDPSNCSNHIRVLRQTSLSSKQPVYLSPWDLKISSLQALFALIWRCMTRVRNFPHDQQTSCRLAINNRTRSNPPMPEGYFGNCIQTVRGTTTAGELLEHDLGWVAVRLHEAVASHSDATVKEWVRSWVENPFVYELCRLQPV